MEEFVTHNQCEEFRKAIDKRLLDGSVKFAELETNMKSVKTTLNLILGTLFTGLGSIVVILLTRGL